MGGGGGGVRTVFSERRALAHRSQRSVTKSCVACWLGSMKKVNRSYIYHRIPPRIHYFQSLFHPLDLRKMRLFGSSISVSIFQTRDSAFLRVSDFITYMYLNDSFPTFFYTPAFRIIAFSNLQRGKGPRTPFWWSRPV